MDLLIQAFFFLKMSFFEPYSEMTKSYILNMSLLHQDTITQSNSVIDNNTGPNRNVWPDFTAFTNFRGWVDQDIANKVGAF